MSRRFVPPAVAVLLAERGEAAPAIGGAREKSYAEGHAEGLRDGHAAGLEEGRLAAQAAVQPVLEAAEAELVRLRAGAEVAAALALVLEARAADRAEMERTLRETLAAALSVLVPAMLATTPGREAAALIAETLAERAAERLTLSAHPDTLALVRQAAPPAGFQDNLAQLADPAAPPGALRLTWAGGGLLHDPSALLGRVLELIRPPELAPDPEFDPERNPEPAEATR